MVNELKSMVGDEETVLYEGKPNRKCFLFESVFNPLLPVAIIWAVSAAFKAAAAASPAGQLKAAEEAAAAAAETAEQAAE